MKIEAGLSQGIFNRKAIEADKKIKTIVSSC